MTAVSPKGVSPRHEIASWPGTKVSAFERLGDVESFMSFCTMCGFHSSPPIFAPHITFPFFPN